MNMNKKIIILTIAISLIIVLAFTRIAFAEDGGGGGCACTYWTNQGCGLNNCLANEQYQTRNCTPEGCTEISRCIYDTSCIKISEESKTVKVGEIFYVYANANSPYKWEIKNYDKEYLDSKMGGVGCNPYENCSYSFQFNALKEGKTIIELNKIDTTYNITVEIKYAYVTITSNITCTDSDNGKNYYVKGTVTQGYGSSSDCCAISQYSPDCVSTSNYLAERFCNIQGNLDTEVISCSNGCKDGACINNTLTCTSQNDCMWCGSECVKWQYNMVCPTITPPQGYSCTCDAGKCTKKQTEKCINHDECSKACDDLGINFKWMGKGSSYKSWTGTCPSNVYGCMSGQCCLGQCPSDGNCYCQRTNVVDIYGSVCPSGQTCGQDCYCHPSVPITEEYKIVNLGEIFIVSSTATEPYKWELKSYDKNYLEQQLNVGGTCSIGSGQTYAVCTYAFSFKSINSGKTKIEIDKINSKDNSIVEIKYIYVTINPSETKIAYLNQPFELKEKESAEIIDYKNMIVTLDRLETASVCPVTAQESPPCLGKWVATVSMRMPDGLITNSMKINLGESKDTPFGVKISFDRMAESRTAVFTVYQGINDFNFYVKTDKYSYSPGESVRIDAILSGSSSINFKDTVIIATVTDSEGKQYEVKMDPIGASASACAQSVSTGTYTCAIINEYHFIGTYDIPSDASKGVYKVLSTAITSLIKKNAETNFEVEKIYSKYVDVKIKPQEQHTVIGKEVYYEITVTDSHPVSLCPVPVNTAGEVGCTRPIYTYYLSVNGLPYNTKYPNMIQLPAGDSSTYTLTVFPSSTGTTEGVATAVTTSGVISKTSSEERIVSIVTGKAVITTPASVSPVQETQPIKEAMFKFTVQATLQDDARITDSDKAILFVRFIETPQPPPFPETEKIDIELRNGWNLISAPGYGYFSSGTCSAASKPVAFIYLTDQKRYVSYDEALRIMETDKLKEYLSTHSFWVYSYENCKITFNIEKYSSYSGLQLDQGWNLLGVTKDMVGETMNNIKGSCTFEKLYSWNAESQKWVEKTENNLIDKMGYGGIVRVSSTCNLNANIIQPPTVQGG